MQSRSLSFQNPNPKVGSNSLASGRVIRAVTARVRRSDGPESLPIGSLPTALLRNYLAEWLDDGEWRGHSPATRALRQQVGDHLLWYLEENSLPSCGVAELRKMLMYLQSAHSEEGGLWHGEDSPPGRWGNPQAIRKVKKSTVHTYHTRLKTFFSWLMKQEYLAVSPMDRLDAPVYRRSQIQPFTDDQMRLLTAVAAARPTRCAVRDVTILWLLYDTGLRVSELCALRRADLDMTEKRLTVRHGKGDKQRIVYFGRYATKALWDYLRQTALEDGSPLFPSESSVRRGQPLAGKSVLQMIERVNAVAEISGVRVTPHTFRHSFAISFLRGGGKIESLKELLGHTSLTQTLVYVQLAQADLESQRRYSPADRLSGGPADRKGEAQSRMRAAKAASQQVAERKAETRKAEVEKVSCGVYTEKITRARVTEDQVREIKRALALPASSRPTRAVLAAEYGLSVSSIKQIALGIVWKHVLI